MYVYIVYISEHPNTRHVLCIRAYTIYGTSVHTEILSVSGFT